MHASIRLSALILGLALNSPGQSVAPLTGELQPVEHLEFAGIASQFLINDARVDGETLYDSQVFIFCSDVAAKSLDEDSLSYPHALTVGNSPLAIGALEDFDVWDRYGTTQDEALAIAQVHWLVDNYYESHFLSPVAGSESLMQYAFQNAIWEIFGDGGTATGLNFSDGNIDRSRFRFSDPDLWNEMNSLIDAVSVSGVGTSYVSTYNVLGVLDERDGYQDYLALAASPELMAVPEPNTAILLGGLAILLIVRRR